MDLKKEIKKYSSLEDDYVIRHNILTVLNKKYSAKLIEGLNSGKALPENAHEETAMMLPEIITEMKQTNEIVLNQLTVLLSNKEISYISKKGMILDDNGYSALYDKKYIRQAEDILWKNRERIFNFVTKPVFLLITIVTFSFACYNFYKNNTTEKDLIKTELKIKQLESKIFQLENNMPKTH